MNYRLSSDNSVIMLLQGCIARKVIQRIPFDQLIFIYYNYRHSFLNSSNACKTLTRDNRQNIITRILSIGNPVFNCGISNSYTATETMCLLDNNHNCHHEMTIFHSYFDCNHLGLPNLILNTYEVSILRSIPR